MAMFLSRLKQILNLGTKSITANGTYSASGDGYDGYSQVSVNMPSVTPSNSNPAALTSGSAVTPSANGYAIESYEKIDVPSAVYTHNIYPNMPTISRVGALVGVEQLHFHSIDPSNSNPATISDGEIYRAGDAGKAVASITDVTPSSTPTSVSADDVVHIQGSGVIVDSIPTPTSITPSNSSPAALTSGNAVTPNANGYAIESYTGIIPDNESPDTITAGNIYKAISSGKAVASINTITPSNRKTVIYPNQHYRITTDFASVVSSIFDVQPNDSNPPSLDGYNDYYIDDPIGGYLYKNEQPKVKKGTFTTSGSSVTEFTVNVGFQPDTIIIFFNGSNGSMSSNAASDGAVRYIYDKDTNATHGFRGYRSTSSSMTVNMGEIRSTGDTRVSEITSTGFKWRNAADSKWNGTYTYIAIQW